MFELDTTNWDKMSDKEVCVNFAEQVYRYGLIKGIIGGTVGTLAFVVAVNVVHFGKDKIKRYIRKRKVRKLQKD